MRRGWSALVVVLVTALMLLSAAASAGVVYVKHDSPGPTLGRDQHVFDETGSWLDSE